MLYVNHTSREKVEENWRRESERRQRGKTWPGGCWRWGPGAKPLNSAGDPNERETGAPRGLQKGVQPATTLGDPKTSSRWSPLCFWPTQTALIKAVIFGHYVCGDGLQQQIEKLYSRRPKGAWSLVWGSEKVSWRSSAWSEREDRGNRSRRKPGTSDWRADPWGRHRALRPSFLHCEMGL